MKSAKLFFDELCREVPLCPPSSSVFATKGDSTDLRIGDSVVFCERSQGSFREDAPTAVIVGAPCDLGVERNGGRPGAQYAPDEIRKQLYKLTSFDGMRSFAPSLQILDIGNLSSENATMEEMQRRQESLVLMLLKQGMLPVVVGGGHEIAYPDGAALGLARNTIAIMNVDAHLDVRPLKNGMGHSGSPFRQLLSDNRFTVNFGAFVEFGIQPFACAEDHVRFAQSHGADIVFYHEIAGKAIPAIFAEKLSALGQNSTAVYVSFDVDSLQSSYAPGVSAPAAMGFSDWEFISMARCAGANSFVELVDFAEMNPLFDTDGRTAKIVAVAIASFLSGMSTREWRKA